MIVARSAVAAALALIASQADAALTVTTRPTLNVDCTAGTCTTTARHANLNASDLMGLLATSDVTVASGTQAKDIEINAALAWASNRRLTLDAVRGIAITDAINVMGKGGLTLDTSHGGALTFSQKAHVSFLDATSSLVIDGATYTLAADFTTLSDAIAENPNGHFAWARDYDAAADGVYAHDPVTVSLHGTFEGLGNAIRNVTIRSTMGGVHLGMFDTVTTASDIHLLNWTIRGATDVTAGGLAANCELDITNVEFSGKITVEGGSFAGGICGQNGFITGARSSGKIVGLDKGHPGGNVMGGITGFTGELGDIYNSYSTMDIVCGKSGALGGLTGDNQGAVENSYAMGKVIGDTHTTAGGLVGIADGPVGHSYATGAVATGANSLVGGLVGNDLVQELFDTYWDVDTSGQSHGAGNDTGDSGVTGLTTEQFLAGLPDGFDPTIWAQDTNVNNGYPYLRAMPPH